MEHSWHSNSRKHIYMGHYSLEKDRYPVPPDYSGSSLSLGYPGMAAVAEEVRGLAAETTLVDLGDAIQGSVVTSETDGKCVMDMMDVIDYDIQIPGNHEFDYGMDAFLEYADEASGEFISCNFIFN